MDRVYAPAFRSVNAGSGLTGSSRVVQSLNRAARGGNHSSHRVSPRGIIAATKGIKATTDYTDFTDWEKEGKEETESELKNSGTDQSVGLTPSREGAKGEGGTTTNGHRWTQRGIAATKGIKATTDYTDFTDWEKEDKEENESELKNLGTDQ